MFFFSLDTRLTCISRSEKRIRSAAQMQWILRSNKRRTVHERTKPVVILSAPRQLKPLKEHEMPRIEIRSPQNAADATRRRRCSVCSRVTCCVYIAHAWSRAIQIEAATGPSRLRVCLALKGVSHYIFRDDLRHFYGKTSIHVDPALRRQCAAVDFFSSSEIVADFYQFIWDLKEAMFRTH